MLIKAGGPTSRSRIGEMVIFNSKNASKIVHISEIIIYLFPMVMQLTGRRIQRDPHELPNFKWEKSILEAQELDNGIM